ncbi:hypothetical protein UlMin_027023 [Ulmus minor]
MFTTPILKLEWTLTQAKSPTLLLLYWLYESRRTMAMDLNDYTIIKEGEAKILMHAKNEIFYNKKQLIAELLATYFLIFAGCASEIVDHKYKTVTLPGSSIVWGLVLMCMIYSVIHISSSHLNPAITIAFAAIKRFPYKQFNGIFKGGIKSCRCSRAHAQKNLMWYTSAIL